MHYLGLFGTAPTEILGLLKLDLARIPKGNLAQAMDLLPRQLGSMEYTPTDLSPEWVDDQDDEWEKEVKEGPQKIVKTYTPKHEVDPDADPRKFRRPWEVPAKYPYPDTGLEEVLLYIAAWEKLLDVKVPDKDVVRVALEEDPPAQLYLPKWETRYYLPKEIGDLPETERPSAVLKLLQKIKSSNEFLKSLDPLPEQS